MCSVQFQSLLICLYLNVIVKKILIYVYSYYDDDEAKFQIEKWKGKEITYIDNVRLCGTLSSQEATKACIVFRIPVRFLLDYCSCIYFCIVLLLLY